jgi:ABC-type transport system substrate-binding protein
VYHIHSAEKDKGERKMHKKISVAIALAFILAMLITIIPVNAWVYPDCTEDDKVEFFGPRADKLLINFYNDEIIEATALEEGKIDFTDWPVTADYVTKWSQPPWNDKIKLVWRGTEFGMFQFDLNNNPNRYLGNPQNPAYPNPKFPNPMALTCLRHAIAHCVDKDYIVSTILGGFAERLDNYVPGCYGIWSNPNVEIHDYNLAEAAAILGECRPLTLDTDYTFYTSRVLRVCSDTATVTITDGSMTWTPSHPYGPNPGAPTIYPPGTYTVNKGFLHLWRSVPEVPCEGPKVIFRVVSGDVCRDEGMFPIGPDGWRYVDWNGNGVKDSGEDLVLDFFIRSDHGPRLEAGHKLVEALTGAPIKIHVAVTEGPSSAARAKVMAAKNFHIYTGGWGLSADPDQGYFLYHIDTYWHPGRPLNYDAVNCSGHNYYSRAFITSTAFAYLYVNDIPQREMKPGTEITYGMGTKIKIDPEPLKIHYKTDIPPGGIKINGVPNSNPIPACTTITYSGGTTIEIGPITVTIDYPDGVRGGALDKCWKAQEIFCSEDCIGAIPLWASAGYTAYRKRYTGGTDEAPVGDGEDIYRGHNWLGVVNEKGFGTWSWYTFYNAHPEGFTMGEGDMTIRWGFRQPTLSLNPLYAEWVWDWYILGKSYEGLIGLNPNTLEDVPGIAYKWEIGTWVPTSGPLAGETLSKVTFYLRDDVVWSDGVPVTAEDVKFTWGGPLDVGSISWWLKQRGLPPAYWSANVADILSVSTPDPWTVEVLLDTTSYFAHHGMSGWNIILPKHIWEPIVSGKPNPYGTDPTADALVFGGPRVCTGPWIIGSYTGVEPSITLYQNPLHYENPRRKAPINKVLRLKNPDFADRHIYRGELCLNEFELGLHNKMYDITFDVDKYIQVSRWNTATSSWDIVLDWTSLGHEDLPTCTWIWENLPSLTLTAGLYNIKVAIKVVSPTTGNPWLNKWINQTYCGALPLPPTTEIPSYYFWVTIKEDIAGTFFKQIGGKNFQDVPDLKVDMKDIGAAAKAFGSYPGHPRWNNFADINVDRKVDMKDIGAIAKKFGWKP